MNFYGKAEICQKILKILIPGIAFYKPLYESPFHASCNFSYNLEQGMKVFAQGSVEVHSVHENGF